MPWLIRKVNFHKYFSVKEIQDPIKTLSKNFHGSLLNSTGSIYYNLRAHLPQHRLKRGRPHDLMNLLTHIL